MSLYDEHLPEDLRDIAERLSAARVTLSPLELDDLRRRVHGRAGRPRRAPRGSFARALRGHLVAVVLTLGLVLTSGVGVVLASDSFGGHGPQPYGNVWQDTNFHFPKFASFCQYIGKKTWTYSWHTPHGILTLILLWDCRFLTYHIYCSQPFGFRWGDTGPWYDTKLTSYTGTAPNSDPGLAVNIGGVTYGFTPDGTPYTSGTPAPSVTVSFNANGGAGAMAAETDNAPTALTPDGFTRPGYTFAGWNTAANGSGAAYGDGATYPFTANTILYAQWTPNPPTYTPPRHHYP
jgi:uncharacterized repeat protein (TIGR02543 family)